MRANRSSLIGQARVPRLVDRAEAPAVDRDVHVAAGRPLAGAPPSAGRNTSKYGFCERDERQRPVVEQQHVHDDRADRLRRRAGRGARADLPRRRAASAALRTPNGAASPKTSHWHADAACGACAAAEYSGKFKAKRLTSAPARRTARSPTSGARGRARSRLQTKNALSGVGSAGGRADRPSVTSSGQHRASRSISRRASVRRSCSVC